MIISPTGLGIRGIDKWGDGAYGAGRGKRKHNGVDFICTPGQNIWFPFDLGIVSRIARPYTKGHFYGCKIVAIDDGKFYICKIFYFQPILSHIVEEVKLCKGMILGKAQDISKKYPGMTPHVHLQVATGLMPDKWINPKNILEVPDEH